MHCSRLFRRRALVALAVFVIASLSALVGSGSALAAAPPKVLGVNPAVGLTTGGETVVVRGANFNASSTVKFGTSVATVVSVDSESQMTVVSPAGAIGPRDVSVTTPDGTSALNAGDRFTYGSTVPTGLRLDASDTSRAAIRWDAPGFAVGSYWIYRDGLLLTTVDRYATHFVDTGLSPGSAHQYRISAMTAFGGGGVQSAALLVLLPSTAQTLTTCPAAPLTGGHYRLGADLAGGANCIQFVGASGASLDCQGHSISSVPSPSVVGAKPVSVSNSSGLLIADCDLPNPVGAVYPGGSLGVVDSQSVTVTDSRFGSADGDPNHTGGGFGTTDSEGVVFENNTVYNSYVGSARSTDGYYGYNVLTALSDRTCPANFAFTYGARNVVIGNEVDGGAPPLGPEMLGSDDAVVFNNEIAAVVADNNFHDNWDAGYETAGIAYDHVVENNVISHTQVAGIGAFYQHRTSWFNNRVLNNQIFDAPQAIVIDTGEAQADFPDAYFMYNQIEGTQFVDPSDLNVNASASSIALGHPATGGHNSFVNNSSPTRLPAPDLEPGWFDEVSGNICQPRAGDPRKIVCEAFTPDAPTVSSVDSISGSPGVPSTIQVHGVGFADATVVTFEWTPTAWYNEIIQNCTNFGAPANRCFTRVSDTLITLRSPGSNRWDPAHVRVTSDSGTRPVGTGDEYLFEDRKLAVTLDSSNGAKFATATPTFGFAIESGTAPYTSECSVDGSPFSPCSSPYTTTMLYDGTHQYAVQVTDAVGDVAQAYGQLEVDTAAPSLSISGLSEGQIVNASSIGQNKSVTIQLVTGSEAVAATCQIDGQPVVDPCWSAQQFTNLAEGSHTVRATASDFVGNLVTVLRHFSVDTTVPDTSFTGGPANGAFVNSSTVNFNLASTEQGSQFACKIDTGAFGSCSQNSSVTFATQGTHSITARAEDAAGNQDATPTSVTFTIDTLAPAVSISSPANGSMTTNTSPPLAFTATDANATNTVCRVDSGTFAACPSTLGPLAAAAHTITVQSTDAAGNVTSSVSSFSVLNPEQRQIVPLAVPSTTENLTSQGTIDWSHWGRADATTWDHKSGASSIFSAFPAGSTTRVTSGVAPAVSWTAGTPTASATTTSGLTNAVSGINNGFTFTVAATNVTPATLRIHAGVLNARGKLDLWWSSNPSNIISDTSLSTTSTSTAANAVFQVAICPPQPSDTLNVRWVQNTSPSPTSSKVRLYSASLTAVGAVRAAAPTTADLSTDGSPPLTGLDWAHWGGASSASTSLTPIARSGATAIPSSVQEGGGTLSRATASTNPVITGYAWSNGDSTASADNIKTGLANTGGAKGRGFSVAIPAASTARTLKLYVGATNSSTTSARPVQLDLFWGSGTIPVVTDLVPTFASATNNYVYTVKFSHPTAGTTLKAKWATATTSTSHKATLQSVVLLDG